MAVYEMFDTPAGPLLAWYGRDDEMRATLAPEGVETRTSEELAGVSEVYRHYFYDRNREVKLLTHDVALIERAQATARKLGPPVFVELPQRG